jgi:hypothetical protein
VAILSPFAGLPPASASLCPSARPRLPIDASFYSDWETCKAARRSPPLVLWIKPTSAGRLARRPQQFQALRLDCLGLNRQRDSHRQEVGHLFAQTEGSPAHSGDVVVNPGLKVDCDCRRVFLALQREIANAYQMTHNPVVDPNRQAPKPQALPPAVRLHRLAAADLKRVTFAGSSLGNALPPIATASLI